MELVNIKAPFVSNLVVAAYGFLKPAQKSYSLYGEDLVLKELFSEKEEGVYFDIGAFHAKWISNTYLLDKRGWRGVAIDVDSKKLFSFRSREKCCICVGAVVPSDFPNDRVIIYKFRRSSSEYDTIHRPTALDYAIRYGLEFDEYEVPAMRIDTLLNEYMQLFGRPIDYLNIDIEGADEDVLVSFDPRIFGIRVISFENNTDYPGSLKIRSHLKANGFQHYSTLGGTHIYVLDEIIAERFTGKNLA
ncbi:MAG: FkbM family methyltransferase [Halioglobus sp.]